MLEIRRPFEVFRFFIPIHAGGAGENRIFTAHRVQGDACPFACVIWTWLRRPLNIAKGLQIALQEVNVIGPGKPNSNRIFRARGGHPITPNTSWWRPNYMTGWASLAFRTVLAIVSVILSFDLSDGI
jgi:hypothetical protein